MDEPQKDFAKWKKLDTKTTYFIIAFIRNIQNRQIHKDRKID